MDLKQKPERYRTLSQHYSPKASKTRKFSNDPPTKLKTSENPYITSKVDLSLRKLKNNVPKESSILRDCMNDTAMKNISELEAIEEGTDLKAYYRSRYFSLIKSLQDSNKQKLLQKEQEELKLKKKKEKLKDELGLSNVRSKFNSTIEEEPEIKSEPRVEKINKPKPEPEQKSPEEAKIKRENAAKIVKRAQEHLQKLADRRIEEQKREEEAQAREFKLRLALKESILGKNHEESDLTRKKSEKLLSHTKKIPITDMVTYKKKHKLKESDKIFIIVGCYPDIRKALKQRGGWYENLDITSPCFDLKWTVRRKDIDFDSLQDHQLCNHFDKSTMITTKVGLSHSLRNLIWHNSVDIDTFYPRCFDLSESAEREDFFTEFKAIKAETILKQAISGVKMSKKVLRTALKICNKRLRDLDDLIDDPNLNSWELVSDSEWKSITSPKSKSDDIASFLPEVSNTLSRISAKYPQTYINGISNIWIIKPAGLSRGRGIELYNSLDEIQDKLNKEGQWVIQKYIETPLTIKKKKFDIRQWVLVTSWNPLTAWFYDKSYLRFGVEEYSIDDLKNKFIHLTNNSIQKNSEKFEQTDIEGNMWHSDEFARYLKEKEGFDIWEEQIKPKVKKMIIHSLECVQDMVDGRKGSCELYGYDIMLDDLYNPWLIEVNCSPAMDYSTPVTEFLVKDVMDDTIKIMVDYFYASYKEKQNVDTGEFVSLVKSDKTVDRPIQSFGLTLLCQGKAIK